MKIRSRAVLCIILVATGGCGAGVKMAQESEHGGIVVYPYKSEQGPVLSSFRKDAVHMMEERCPSGHTIIREGETKGRSRLSGPVQTGGEIIQERRWGIQFQCK